MLAVTHFNEEPPNCYFKEFLKSLLSGGCQTNISYLSNDRYTNTNTSEKGHHQPCQHLFGGSSGSACSTFTIDCNLNLFSLTLHHFLTVTAKVTAIIMWQSSLVPPELKYWRLVYDVLNYTATAGQSAIGACSLYNTWCLTDTQPLTQCCVLLATIMVSESEAFLSPSGETAPFIGSYRLENSLFIIAGLNKPHM